MGFSSFLFLRLQPLCSKAVLPALKPIPPSGRFRAPSFFSAAVPGRFAVCFLQLNKSGKSLPYFRPFCNEIPKNIKNTFTPHQACFLPCAFFSAAGAY